MKGYMMKELNFMMLIICFLGISTVYADTITYNGLEITVTSVKSEFDDILEFLVKAKNTINKEKTLLGTIYLNAEKYPGLKIEETSTAVYLELEASGSAEDVFYLVTSITIPSPEWFFKVEEVYDFIVDTDFDNNDDTETEDIDYPDSGKEEEKMFSITGYWKMEKNENSKIYGNWSWLFNDDGSLKIEEILGAEARLPMSYEGSYEIKGNRVIITLFAGSPFPGSFTIQGDKLVAEDIVLSRSDVSGDF
ncbi:MAG: hypothetical protein JXB88_20560 [Spirochaetales bacterium]|nr:hypothetical protein [Spirochaetales bacterium]